MSPWMILHDATWALNCLLPATIFSTSSPTWKHGESHSSQVILSPKIPKHISYIDTKTITVTDCPI